MAGLPRNDSQDSHPLYPTREHSCVAPGASSSCIKPEPVTVLEGMLLDLPRPDFTVDVFDKCNTGHCLRSKWWCPSYLADWLIVAFLGAALIIEIIFWNVQVRPYQPAAILPNGNFTYDDNQFQFVIKSNTFQEWVTAIISIGLPCMLVILYHLWRWFGPAKDRTFHDLHHFILGMATAIVLAFFAWIPINKTCGSFRPDFWYRLLTGDADEIETGRESFPSGHTLAAFLGLGFFMHWLSGKLFVFQSSGGFVWRFCIAVICPMALAIAQAVSRVTDNRHRTVDILGGAVLGIGAAVCAYHLNYPPLWAPDCHRPKNRRLAYPTYLLTGVITASKSIAAEE